MEMRGKAFTLVELLAVSKRKAVGFTLVELLLLVVSMIGVLAAMLTPSPHQAMVTTKRSQFVEFHKAMLERMEERGISMGGRGGRR